MCDLDELPHRDASFEYPHEGLHCLQGKYNPQRKEYNVIWKTITYDLSIYTMDHPKFPVSNQKVEFISALRVKLVACQVMLCTVLILNIQTDSPCIHLKYSNR